MIRLVQIIIITYIFIFKYILLTRYLILNSPIEYFKNWHTKCFKQTFYNLKKSKWC